MKKIILLLALILLFTNLVKAEEAEINVYDYSSMISDDTNLIYLDNFIEEYLKELNIKSKFKMIFLLDKEYNNQEFKSYFHDFGLGKSENPKYDILILLSIKPYKERGNNNFKINRISATHLINSGWDENKLSSILTKAKNRFEKSSPNTALVRDHVETLENLIIDLVDLIPPPKEGEILLDNGTIIPESIILDGRMGKQKYIYPTFEYICNSDDITNFSCEEIKDKKLIQAKVEIIDKPSNENVSGWESFKNKLLQSKPRYDVLINEDSDETAKNYSEGNIMIKIDTSSLFEGQKYVLKIDSYEKKKPKRLLTKPFEIKFKILESKCKTFKKGNEEKFKIYVWGEEYLNDEFKEDLKNIIDYEGTGFGLFSIEPFKTHKEKFTISYNTYTQGSHDFVKGACDYDIGISISDTPFRAYAYRDLNQAYISKSKKDSIKKLQKVTVHEFGHAFAGLADEYIEEGKYDISRSPNCAPDETTAIKWWGDLMNVGEWLRKVNVIDGCSYRKGNFRPTKNSVMNDQNLVLIDNWLHGFDPVNERCLLKIIKSGKMGCKESDLSELKRYTPEIKRIYS